VDFWLVKGLALTAAGQPAWSAVPEGSLVGAVRFSGPFRDIRGRTLKPGVYTLRYGIQPANGDHLGISPYRDFLLAAPAGVDTQPTAIGHDAVVELSRRATGLSHPAPFSLDPPVAPADAKDVVTNSEGHQSVILSVPVSRDGKPAGALKFGLILVGRIEA
jgi:hypothetical protein